jgi:hypothetical protein
MVEIRRLRVPHWGDNECGTIGAAPDKRRGFLHSRDSRQPLARRINERGTACTSAGDSIPFIRCATSSNEKYGGTCLIDPMKQA